LENEEGEDLRGRRAMHRGILFVGNHEVDNIKIMGYVRLLLLPNQCDDE
jgi:hypothetical protein